MIHNSRVTCDLKQLSKTPVKSSIPVSGSLDVLFTRVTKLFYKEKSGGRGKTDCVIIRSEGMEGDIFGTLKPYERWGVS